MTTSRAWDCATAGPALGVYVLGAIDPAERGLVDGHLAACPQCRAEMAGLAGLPALLARLTPDEAGMISGGDLAPASVRDPGPGEPPGAARDLAGAKARRNGWRYPAAAAAVVILAAGLFAGLRAAGPARVVAVPFQAGGGWRTAQAASRLTGASATVAYAHQQWGTAVDVLAEHIPLGTTCQLWAVHPDGTRTLAAAWTTASDEGHVWYAGSVPGSAGVVTEFQITAADGRLLLTVMPA